MGNNIINTLILKFQIIRGRKERLDSNLRKVILYTITYQNKFHMEKVLDIKNKSNKKCNQIFIKILEGRYLF